LIAPFEVLLESGDAQDALAPDLAAIYGGPLSFPRGGGRLYLIANFVATIDGVVSFGRAVPHGTSLVSGGAPADRFVMALLRAAADVIVIGAGTLRADPQHQWIPYTLVPDLAPQLEAYRQSATGAGSPAPLVVVSGSGAVPTDHPAFTAPRTAVTVFTTERGTRALSGSSVHLQTLGADESGRLTAQAIVDQLQAGFGARLVLCEGGPSLLGQLVGAGRVDELFLTVAPQIAGRDGHTERPALIEGFAADARRAPQATLLSARKAGDHLFLRYRIRRAAPIPGAAVPI
jgi:riboflavin biosynthesis pyrimidine reductase